MPNNVTLVGAKASGRALREIGPRSDVLHLATHSGLGRGGGQAYLELADGPFTLEQIYGLALPPGALVVHSSCQSALGKDSPQREVTSLASAFNIAGASTVIASHWEVDDQQTSRLFQSFYRHLLAGRNRGEALRRARRELAQTAPHLSTGRSREFLFLALSSGSPSKTASALVKSRFSSPAKGTRRSRRRPFGKGKGVRVKTSRWMNRRRFLQYSASAWLGASLLPTLGWAAAQNPPKVAPEERRRVLVLGAGMAGLTAALALQRRGHEVTVIEYQPRVGGRLWSLPLAGGQFTEAGGGHFRSNMPYVLSYIRRFGLPLLSLNDGLPRYLFEGKTADGAVLSDWPWALHEDERKVTVSSVLNHYLFKAGFDTDTVLEASWPDPETIRRYDHLTVGEMLRQVGASEAFLKVLEAHGGTFTTASPALGTLPDLAYHFGDENLFRIAGGNQRLPEAMAAELGHQHLVLDAPVTAIDQGEHGVRVTVKDGRAFEGDRVISTIPFTVLGEVAVTPVWSPGKLRMFKEFEWSNTVKVVVQTRNPGWLAKGVHGWPMAGSDRPWERVIDITGNEGGGYGNLFFYLNDRNADAYLAQPKATRGKKLVEMFQSDLPGLIENVVEIRDVAWSEQPWIKASFGGPGLDGSWMIQEWTKPEGRVHFAGDYTTMKTGWVEGAIESGLRAARQIDAAAPSETSDSLRQERRQP